MRRTAKTVSFDKMSLRSLHLDSFRCHKWIAVSDIYMDFELMPYNQYNFNDLYIVENSGDNDGIFCVLRPHRNSVGEWSRADLWGYIKKYTKLLTFIDLRAPFMHLRTDESININGKIKHKVFILFPSMNPIETAVTCLYLKHHDHRYSVTDCIPFWFCSVCIFFVNKM